MQMYSGSVYIWYKGKSVEEMQEIEFIAKRPVTNLDELLFALDEISELLKASDTVRSARYALLRSRIKMFPHDYHINYDTRKVALV